jgi:hypothetical membrane protein
VTNISRSKANAGAILLILAPLVFFFTEAIVASFWENPAYSYTYNFISDLGVPVVTEFEGRPIDSSLYSVMNLGLIVYADLFVTAFCMLFHMLPKKGGTMATILAVLYGIGVTFVAIFPGYYWPGFFMHAIGALLIIFGGGFVLMIYGSLFNQVIQKKWFSLLSVTFCIIGFISIAICVLTTGDNRGFFERVSIYSLLIWEILTGVLLLASIGKSKN